MGSDIHEKNNYYFYHYQVFKIKYRNLNTINVCVLFYMGPPHVISRQFTQHYIKV